MLFYFIDYVARFALWLPLAFFIWFMFLRGSTERKKILITFVVMVLVDMVIFYFFVVLFTLLIEAFPDFLEDEEIETITSADEIIALVKSCIYNILYIIVFNFVYSVYKKKR